MELLPHSPQCLKNTKHKLVHKKEQEGTLPHSSYEASVILIAKLKCVTGTCETEGTWRPACTWIL